MAIDERPQLPLGSGTISRRRFLEGAALAGALVSVPYLAGKEARAQEESTTAAARPAEGTFAALDRALEDLVAMPGGPPGVIALVQRGKRLSVHRFGVADLSTGRRMRSNEHMRIASVAKAFSGATALSLVSKGKLSLGDTISELLPDLPKAWSRVTLRQLLSHTSGIPDFSKNAKFLAAVRANLTKAPPPAELLSYVANEELRFVPGSRYEYSNSDNIAVGLMIESATKRSYESQLKKQVLGPLGLTKTSLPAGPRLSEPFIHGYDNDPPQPEDLSEVLAAGWSWASGGIVATPADLNSFIRGYVGGRLFDSQTRSRQRQVVEGGGSEPPGPGTNAAGLAVFRYKTRCGMVWGHTGNTPGYTQFAAASPDGSRSATVSINAQNTPTVGAPGVFEALRRAEGLAVCAALADE